MLAGVAGSTWAEKPCSPHPGGLVAAAAGAVAVSVGVPVGTSVGVSVGVSVVLGTGRGAGVLADGSGVLLTGAVLARGGT